MNTIVLLRRRFLGVKGRPLTLILLIYHRLKMEKKFADGSENKAHVFLYNNKIRSFINLLLIELLYIFNSNQH